MQRVEIRDLHKVYTQYADKTITVCGWARTIRDSKNIAFVEINDGAFKSVQIVVEREKINNYDEIVKQRVGASFMVNGKVVNIPSFSVKPGMVIAVRPKSKSLEVITSSLSTRSVSKYGWLEFDNSEMQGKFLNVPDRSEIPENIKEQLIVELYSKQ